MRLVTNRLTLSSNVRIDSKDSLPERLGGWGSGARKEMKKSRWSGRMEGLDLLNFP